MSSGKASQKMNRQVYEEASDWVVQHREGDMDECQKRAFDTWLRRSPDHVQAYLEMSSLWEDMSSLDPKEDASPAELIADARGPRTSTTDARGLRNLAFAALKELLLRISDAAPLVINVDDLERRLDRLDHQLVKQSLRDLGFGEIRSGADDVVVVPEEAVDLLATYCGQAPLLKEWLRGAQINTGAQRGGRSGSHVQPNPGE